MRTLPEFACISGSTPASVQELRTLRDAFKTTPVSAVLEAGSISAFVPIDPTANDFLDVFLLLGKYGIHRAWMVSGNDVTNVVTQSAVVDILAKNLEHFAGLTHKTIASLELGSPKAVVGVTLSDTFWDAFRLMHEHHVSAVPISTGGKIVGVISSRDLRQMILEPAHFATLGKPIGQYFTQGTCGCATRRRSHRRRAGSVHMQGLRQAGGHHQEVRLLPRAPPVCGRRQRARDQRGVAAGRDCAIRAGAGVRGRRQLLDAPVRPGLVLAVCDGALHFACHSTSGNTL